MARSTTHKAKQLHRDVQTIKFKIESSLESAIRALDKAQDFVVEYIRKNQSISMADLCGAMKMSLVGSTPTPSRHFLQRALISEPSFGKSKVLSYE